MDYVGITNHLKDALADYADADRDEIMASLRDKSKDIDALNTAYNEIIQFLNEKVGYALSQTSDIIEELCVDEELREEYNGRFTVISRLFDRVLPNPAALEYSEDYKMLAFIRESVAKMTRIRDSPTRMPVRKSVPLLRNTSPSTAWIWKLHRFLCFQMIF